MPENTQETGRHARLARIGKRTQWKKGCPSPNPGGRPRTAQLSKAYRKLLETVDEKDPGKRTWAERVAEAIVRRAIKDSVSAAREIAGRSEGKAGPEEVLVQVNVAQAMSDAELLARIEELRREQREILATFRDGHEPIDDGTPV